MNEANLYYHNLFNNSKKVELVLKKGLKCKGIPVFSRLLWLNQGRSPET